MELNNIEKLLERYEEGDTSLAEENMLREYFLEEDVPAHLMSYQMMFRYTSQQRKETFVEQPRVTTAKNWYTWASVAAILVLALGLFFHDRDLNENDLVTRSDEEVALKKAKEALTMVSQIMNEGKSDLIYLKEFNKTKNKIIQID